MIAHKKSIFPQNAISYKGKSDAERHAMGPSASGKCCAKCTTTTATRKQHTHTYTHTNSYRVVYN